jgi:hypothetical protein
MAYVNEFVPEEDVRKYGLEEINARFRKVDVRYSWTIDREKDIYLRLIDSGREEFCDEYRFNLYWKGSLLLVKLRVKGAGVRGGAGWSRWSLLKLDLPETLESQRDEILSDLKLALSAFKDFGIRSSTTEHTASFDF